MVCSQTSCSLASSDLSYTSVADIRTLVLYSLSKATACVRSNPRSSPAYSVLSTEYSLSRMRRARTLAAAAHLSVIHVPHVDLAWLSLRDIPSTSVTNSVVPLTGRVTDYA